MSAQRGYVDIDIIGMIWVVAIVGVGAGLVLCPILSWAWGVIKPWLHVVTG